MSGIMFFLVLALALSFLTVALVTQHRVWRDAERDAAEREARRKERVLESLAPVDWPNRWRV